MMRYYRGEDAERNEVMGLILLIAGAALYFMGRIEIGTLRAEGKHVKVAGIILALPSIVTLLLVNFFVPMAFGSHAGTVASVNGVIYFLELIAMLAAIGIAYILIADPPNAPRLPGILGDIQQEARTSQPARPARPSKVINIPTPAATLRPKINFNRDSFPSVMNLKEAARYMQVSEDDVLKLIEEGKLTAARDNYNYKIAKSQLDELM